jgi:peptidylprolyl isomerase
MTAIRILMICGCVMVALALIAGCAQPATGSTPITPVVTTTVGAGVPASTQSMAGSTQLQTRVRLETTMGNITIALDPEMPITAGNFETLVKKGFYDGIIFHRVMDGFMIQGGDPKGAGRGGLGYVIPDEFTTHNKNNRGAVAMANAGANTGSSQFFINLVNNNYLDTKHPVFGQVVEGMDVVDAIGKVATDQNARPIQNVTIVRAVMV